MPNSWVAGGSGRAYLTGDAGSLAMPEATVETPASAARPFVLVAAVAGVLIAGTLMLWAHYGSAVFFEMIAAGIAACF
jgi:hypothetical protein